MSVPLESDRLKNVLFYGILLLLGYLVYRIFQPFFEPLAWAGVLVVVFYPVQRFLEARWGGRRAAYASTLAVTLMLIVPVLLLATVFVNQGIAAYQAFDEARKSGALPGTASLEQAWLWARARLPLLADVEPLKVATQAAQFVAGFVASRASAVARNVAVFLFNLSVMVFAMYHLFRDASRIVAGIRRLLPFEEGMKDRMMGQARDLIQASVTSTLIVAAVQGLLGGIALWALGFDAPVVWGVVMAFCSLLPVAGSGLVWGPAAIWLLVSGDVLRGVILLAVGGGLVGSVDNVLRPMLVSGRARLSELLIFVSLLGGISVFGMLGVVLGPIVVATAMGVLEVYTKRETPGAEPPAS